MKVAEVLRMLHDDGWYLYATRGSHRQFRHPSKRGRVTFRENQAMTSLGALSAASLSKLSWRN